MPLDRRGAGQWRAARGLGRAEGLVALGSAPWKVAKHTISTLGGQSAVAFHHRRRMQSWPWLALDVNPAARVEVQVCSNEAGI